MAGPTVEVVFESRLPGSDGAYTDQKVVLVETLAPLGWYKIGHDLGRTPDWVRVTKLTLGKVIEGEIPWAGPVTAPMAHLEAAIDLFQSGMGDRLAWDVGEVGNAGGRPLTVVNTTIELWFGAQGDWLPGEGPGDPPVAGDDAYYLVEFGITHSQSK